MKIYKLDIDAAQPTNQVVQMQQNTVGVLSVNVTKNGNYIHNLSCQMFDGETEISACSAGDKGFKLDIGDTPKHYTVKATATPIESVAQYIVKNGTTRLGTKALSCAQLPAGVYRQDEFYGLAERFGDKSGSSIRFLTTTAATRDNVNFFKIGLMPLNKEWPVWFYDGTVQNPILLPQDTLISVDGHVEIIQEMPVKQQGLQISSYTYPAVGYYVNYQSDTLVKPSPNANAFSEIEVLPTEASFQTLSADSFTTESFTLSSVTYVPTTLSVDGVEYTVLAAPVETPSETVEG